MSSVSINTGYVLLYVAHFITLTNLGKCTRAHAGVLVLTQLLPWAHMASPGQMSRYYGNPKRQAGTPQWTPGMPNADLICHKITNNVLCSPNAIDCMPESVKLIDFFILFLTFNKCVFFH